MTPPLRAKIFGLNAARVYGVKPVLHKASAERDPHFMTYGPKTRHDFFEFLRIGPV